MAQDTETTRVLFRVERGRTREVTAVFPDLAQGWGTDVMCYAHVGQHGSCSMEWLRGTRPAKPEEYADLKAELEAEPYGYNLVVLARIDRSL